MGERINTTKQKLLAISKQLMMSKGYNATTVDEICKIAEVTKGAFFYYFKTKEELGVNVLNYYWHNRQQQFAEFNWVEEKEPLNQIQGFLDAVADVFMNDPDGYSCLAGSFTQELAETNQTFQELVSILFTEWAKQIKPVLQAAKDSAASPDDIDIDLLADYIVGVIEGALILASARQNRNLIARHLELLIAHLQCIFST